MPLPPNTRLGRYEIRSLLGAGGMGEVFLAEDVRLDRKVALKLLPEKFSANAGALSRFIQEAKSASALNHPNIITVFDIGEFEGKHFIAVEFIDGDTLRERMSAGRILFDEILSISIQTAEALSAAHRAGIIHRDIKPENVMLQRDGYVKVLDFGLAKLTEPKPVGKEESTLVHSNPADVRGMVAYMSPEQARGLRVDSRTDIWSFGVLLYELLARRMPFTGDTATDAMLSIIQKEPPALQFIAPDLPNEIYFREFLPSSTKKGLSFRACADFASSIKSAGEPYGRDVPIMPSYSS